MDKKIILLLILSICAITQATDAAVIPPSQSNEDESSEVEKSCEEYCENGECIDGICETGSSDIIDEAPEPDFEYNCEDYCIEGQCVDGECQSDISPIDDLFEEEKISSNIDDEAQIPYSESDEQEPHQPNDELTLDDFVDENEGSLPPSLDAETKSSEKSSLPNVVENEIEKPEHVDTCQNLCPNGICVNGECKNKVPESESGHDENQSEKEEPQKTTVKYETKTPSKSMIETEAGRTVKSVSNVMNQINESFQTVTEAENSKTVSQLNIQTKKPAHEDTCEELCINGKCVNGICETNETQSQQGVTLQNN